MARTRKTLAAAPVAEPVTPEEEQIPQYKTSRSELYLNYILGSSETFPQNPSSRLEEYLYYLCKYGSNIGLKAKKVDALPEVGKGNILYLVPVQGTEGSDSCNEYLWIDNTFELVGNTRVDLSQYSKATNLENGIILNTIEQKSIIDTWIGDEHVVETTKNTAGQLWAVTLGRANTSGPNGFAALTSGTRNNNDGDSAFVGGVENETKAKGMASISTGVGNINEGRSSIVAGEDNNITEGARGSLTVGHNNTSDSSGGITGGKHNDNHGDNSLCVGEYLKTNWKNKNVVGLYNDYTETNKAKLFVVGNGKIQQSYPEGTNIQTTDLNPSYSMDETFIIDFKLQSDSMRFMLGDGWSNYLGYFIVYKDGTLDRQYTGVSIQVLSDGYIRVTIIPRQVADKQGSPEKINLFYPYTGQGLFRINPELIDVEVRQNAFEVYEDGHSEVQVMGETPNSVVTKDYVDNLNFSFVVYALDRIQTSTLPAIWVPAIFGIQLSQLLTAFSQGKVCFIKTLHETMLVNQSDSQNNEIKLWYHDYYLTYALEGDNVVVSYKSLQ